MPVEGCAATARARLLRPTVTLRAMARELRRGASITGDSASFRRYAADVLLFRLLRLADLPFAGRTRHLTLREGVEFTYRLDRGDIQSIREVWIDEAYRLPFPFRPTVVIDLGANIGLTSLFFAKTYGSTRVIAVEPVPANARLARENLARNNVSADVVEAAVGPCDGWVHFELHRASNMGRIGSAGKRVPVMSMASVLARTESGFADLVKMDIEGGEAALLEGDIAWLQRVGSLIVEFHPAVVDYPALVGVIEGAGFRYLPAGSAWPGSMDCFVRSDWPI